MILEVGLPQVEDTAQAQMLAGLLVRVAEAVLCHANVGHVFAEGGATAVLSMIGGGSRLFTIKPGSYAWPEFLLGGRFTFTGQAGNNPLQ